MVRCRETGDYSPVLLEWYKFVAALCCTFSFLERESPALNKMERREYSILVGLLSRCYRLMLANVALSHEGKFGETTSIIDRCIFETCIILSWLCQSTIVDRLERYIAHGLRTELELKKSLLNNISARDGKKLIIENRMLKSIGQYIKDAGMDDEKIEKTKKLPDLASMIESIGQDRLAYVVGQRIGSHHVHGTWVSLKMQYLEDDEDGESVPRGSPLDTHVNQYVYIPLVVLNALSSFISYVFEDKQERLVINNLIKSTSDKIQKINQEVVLNDFEEVSE